MTAALSHFCLVQSTNAIISLTDCQSRWLLIVHRRYVFTDMANSWLHRTLQSRSTEVAQTASIQMPIVAPKLQIGRFSSTALSCSVQRASCPAYSSAWKERVWTNLHLRHPN